MTAKNNLHESHVTQAVEKGKKSLAHSVNHGIFVLQKARLTTVLACLLPITSIINSWRDAAPYKTQPLYMKQEEPRIRYMTYTNGADLRLPQDAANVIAGMTDNRNFPDPPVAILDLATMLDEYRLLIKPPGDRTTQSSNEKAAKKQPLIEALVSIGLYAEMIAAGDLAKLQSSGFMLISRNTVTAVPTQGIVTRFKTNGNPHTLEIVCKTEPNVSLYEARVFVGNATEPLIFASQSATIRCTNLPLGELLRIEVRKQNTEGFGPYGPTYKTRLPTEGEMFPVG